MLKETLTISNRWKLSFLLVLAVFLLALLVDLPRLLNQNTGGVLRQSILRTAEVIVPLKDRMLGRTVNDKLARLKSTGACQFCDLTNVNMSGFNLSELDLRNANLSHANLIHSKLSGAYLRNANLTKANLTDAEIDRAKLDKAVLANAILISANLEEAELFEADLTGADLSQSNLKRAELVETDLTGADLTRANLRETQLQRAKLERAILTNAKLINADLNGADLTGATLDQTVLINVDITNATIQKENLDQALLCYTRTIDGTVLECDLSGGNLTGADLSEMDLSEATLTGANLSEANLAGANLTGVNLSEANLRGAFLFKANLNGANLTGANLHEAILNMADLTVARLTSVNLAGASLPGADLSEANLAGANLSEANLSEANLVGTNLSGANLTGADLSDTILTQAYLYDAKLVDADLGGANLVGARLSGADLTGASLRRAELGTVDIKRIDRYEVGNLIEVKENKNYSSVTSFDLSGDVHYLTTKSGIVYELKNGESTIVLDLNDEPKFVAATDGSATGLFSVASTESFIYLSYTVETDDGRGVYLVVDEFSKAFVKTRTIVKIEFEYQDRGPTFDWIAGTLAFDNLGILYLSVGEGGAHHLSQDLTSLRGKILRIDVSKRNPEPEIVAYGLRNPWKISIDLKNRMFIGDCGPSSIESVYLLENLNPVIPYNLGWPIFIGTERRLRDPLAFKDTLPPIYEYRHYYGRVGGCAIGGFFLDKSEVYLLGDFFGIVRLLKKQKDGKWREIYSQKLDLDIWSFGYNELTEKIYLSGSKLFELTILTEKLDLLPRVTLCRTAIPDGTINNSDC